MTKFGIDNILDFLGFNDAYIDTLTFDRSTTERDIPLGIGDKTIIRLFRRFVEFRDSIGDPIDESFDQLTPEEFDEFRLKHGRALHI